MGLRLRLSGDGCRERLLAFSDVFRESRFDPASKRTPPVLADETGGPGMRWKRGWPKGKRASSDDQSRVLVDTWTVESAMQGSPRHSTRAVRHEPELKRHEEDDEYDRCDERW